MIKADLLLWPLNIEQVIGYKRLVCLYSQLYLYSIFKGQSNITKEIVDAARSCLLIGEK